MICLLQRARVGPFKIEADSLQSPHRLKMRTCLSDIVNQENQRMIHLARSIILI